MLSSLVVGQVVGTPLELQQLDPRELAERKLAVTHGDVNRGCSAATRAVMSTAVADGVCSSIVAGRVVGIAALP